MTTDPRDALIVGDDSDLSESTRAWLATLPLQNTPAQVLDRHMRAAALEDAAEDRERERRRTAALADREDLAAVAWVRGDEAATVSVAERFAQWAAMDEIEERNNNLAAARRAQRRADEQAVVQAERIERLEAELAAERQGHARTSQQYHEAVAGWGRANHRARQQGSSSQSRGSYYRTGGSVVRGPY